MLEKSRFYDLSLYLAHYVSLQLQDNKKYFGHQYISQRHLVSSLAELVLWV